ncbi:hypothetical protein MTBBW1_2000004 [Desulfamplus magnetovallimortis]|uniref:Uncharacterized protein n=1 Tax=Desulfamplus magnetovallimortis TaxID=1246637 RepID=A0A1W1HBN4_9BACT|nr:hypothetical protein [Desulfamplus magnetovallimortis]SLM29890.1 hypothetical protein MTBBW1_2000004 [Desulfamplus magnetovallimortis]
MPDNIFQNKSDQNPEIQILFENIKLKLPELEELLENSNSNHNYEYFLYRFYHGSYKVEYAIGMTKIIVKTLQNIYPEKSLNSLFLKIIHEGTEVVLDELRENWDKARPILEAFLHAKYFL